MILIYEWFVSGDIPKREENKHNLYAHVRPFQILNTCEMKEMLLISYVLDDLRF